MLVLAIFFHSFGQLLELLLIIFKTLFMFFLELTSFNDHIIALLYPPSLYVLNHQFVHLGINVDFFDDRNFICLIDIVTNHWSIKTHLNEVNLSILLLFNDLFFFFFMFRVLIFILIINFFLLWEVDRRLTNLAV